MSTESNDEDRIAKLERKVREQELELEVQSYRLAHARTSRTVELLLVLSASLSATAIGYLLAVGLEFIPELVNDSAPILLIAALGWALATAVLRQAAASRGSNVSYRYRTVVAQAQLVLILAATAWLSYDKSRASLEFALGAQLGFFFALAGATVHDLARQFARFR